MKITQSLPIIEYLEEKFPGKNTLLPKDILLRAKVSNCQKLYLVMVSKLLLIRFHHKCKMHSLFKHSVTNE